MVDIVDDFCSPRGHTSPNLLIALIEVWAEVICMPRYPHHQISMSLTHGKNKEKSFSFIGVRPGVFL